MIEDTTAEDSVIELNATTFRGVLNQNFVTRIDEQGTTIDLELIRVDSLTEVDSERTDKEPFSLLFRGPADPLIDQQIVGFDNEQLGNVHIFVVPLGPDRNHEGRGLLYEAVFT